MSTKLNFDRLARRIRLQLILLPTYTLSPEELQTLIRYQPEMALLERTICITNFATTYGLAVHVNADGTAATFFL